MNDRHSERINTNNHLSELKIEFPFEQILLPKLDVLDHGVAKCGNIFTSNGDFIFVCLFCDDNFDTMLTFGEHIQRKHLQLCEGPRNANVNAQTDTDRDQIENAPIITQNEQEAIFTGICRDESYSCPSENSKTGLSENEFINEKRISKLEIEFDSRLQPTEYLDKFCAFCNRQFKYEKSFKQHQALHKNTNQMRQESLKPESKNAKGIYSSLYCDICDRHFKAKHNFRNHAARHSTVPLALQRDPNYFKCLFCNKEFTDHINRFEHERSHDDNRRYSCPHCLKSFQTNAERKVHIIIHSVSDERPFKCDKCSKTFVHARNLRSHIQTHLGITRFACEICGKGFLIKSDKEGHVRTHTGEKPFQCEVCGRNFISRNKLNEHRKRHTGIKNCKCEICGSVFYSKDALRGHKVKHSDARPHQCSECGASFPRRRALKSHEKIHSDIKEYVCNICGKEYSQAAGLYAHKKSHGENLFKGKQ